MKSLPSYRITKSLSPPTVNTQDKHWRSRLKPVSYVKILTYLRMVLNFFSNFLKFCLKTQFSFPFSFKNVIDLLVFNSFSCEPPLFFPLQNPLSKLFLSFYRLFFSRNFHGLLEHSQIFWGKNARFVCLFACIFLLSIFAKEVLNSFTPAWMLIYVMWDNVDISVGVK